ncbi:unnamed protein product [Effrenium voratum]|uniref:Uncharacterized protein n=1 Tax=Effrenium voratum TaxID=2562239 RepID=A0AA36IN34_9DINO|nr:unnamed protein product [Effrenium voratum]CAJ1416112.1 unnamed protein product [Effrenium voratum]
MLPIVCAVSFQPQLGSCPHCSVEGPHHDISLMSHLVCGFDPSARGKAVNLHSVKQLELSLPSALSFARTEANKKQQLTRQPISCVDLSTTNTATSTAAVVNWVVPARKEAAAFMPFFAMLMRHTSIFVFACKFQSPI